MILGKKNNSLTSKELLANQGFLGNTKFGDLKVENCEAHIRTEKHRLCGKRALRKLVVDFYTTKKFKRRKESLYGNYAFLKLIKLVLMLPKLEKI